ncbi:MAG: AAA family ATPase [Nitrosopumilaceae archaeon]
MINSIELGNFLSHSDTKLEFYDGVTVFVGNNGAGKSSIIDAITFALFGKHSRKTNKSLIKRGTTQGFAKINFTINGKELQAERKIDVKGGLAAQFSEKSNGEWLQIAAGERKQFGESMTHEVEKKIGLEFEKLKIASIVQQGELNSIIKAKPKEFKELLNAIIGIDKLDVASDAMKLVNKNFREKIRQDIGYDDTHIEILNLDLEKYHNELEKSKPLKGKLSSKREKSEKELLVLTEKLERETPKLDKLKQLELRKKELREYAKEAILEIKNEIEEKERKILDCKGCFEYVGLAKDLQIKLEKEEFTIKDSLKRLQKLTNLKASLVEKQSLASKLKLKDNKCPVCDSKVSKLNPLFQEEHLKQELEKNEDVITTLQKDIKLFEKNRFEFSEKLQKAKESQATLRAHSIKDQADLKKIQKDIEDKKVNVKKVPLIISTGNLVEVAQLDSHSKMLFENISQLELETKGFAEVNFVNLKESISEKQDELSRIDQEIGAITEKISEAEQQIKFLKKAISEVKVVRDYVEELDTIQTNIFNRDGAVATSLRSWALNTISVKASEYLALLNTKIQRIFLSEKIRDVVISCYSRNEVLEIESLSGGEQVSVALALRLGMANLLGASHLNLIILDEPTTHLDAERRKSLVAVLSQLSNITNVGAPMQFIIITHDSEIFEDSTVEHIYKFESTEQGSKVTAL